MGAESRWVAVAAVLRGCGAGARLARSAPPLPGRRSAERREPRLSVRRTVHWVDRSGISRPARFRVDHPQPGTDLVEPPELRPTRFFCRRTLHSRRGSLGIARKPALAGLCYLW